MEKLFIFLLKSVICITLYYPFYKVLLSKETFHRINRIVLLCIFLSSIILPFVQISGIHHSVISAPIVEIESLLLNENNAVTSSDIETSAAFQWPVILLAIYFTGLLFCLCSLLWQLRQMLKIFQQGRREEYDGCTLIIVSDNVSSFSWMNHIVMAESDYRTNLNTILSHELAHIRNRHSWDIMLANICIMLQWFNPIIWLMKNELQAIHEYEADEYVLSLGVNAKVYQLLLIQKTAGITRFKLAHNFIQGSLQKRISMMLHERSSAFARVKILFILPVSAFALMAFAHPSIDESGIMSSSSSFGLQTQGEAAEFPGGVPALMDYFKNAKANSAAYSSGSEVKVIVKFVIEADGSITHPEISRSVTPELDSEAIRMVKNMPRWTPYKKNGVPVSCIFLLPVVFHIDQVPS